jgi:hypothetical protein
MVDEEEREGAWQAVPRIAGGALSIPVVLGFVALGTAVVVGRSLRDGVRQVWTWSTAWRTPRREEPVPTPEAAPETPQSHAA